MRARAILATLLLVASLPATAKTSVWLISGDGHQLYLAGTIHLLREQDFPLPKEYDAAYKHAAKVVFETDPAQLAGPEFQREILARGLYADGHSLKEVLTPETWKSLATWCDQRGMPVALLERMRAEFAVLNISVIELANMGLNQIGIDFVYFNRARAEGKPRGQLETMKEQLDAIFSLPPGKEDALVRETLDEMEQTPAMMDAMLTAWRAGDVEALEGVMLDPMRKYPDIYESLLAKRNRAWVPELVQLLRTPETELVLVGAGHLIGPDGLLQAMAKRGFTVTQYTPQPE